MKKEIKNMYRNAFSWFSVMVSLMAAKTSMNSQKLHGAKNVSIQMTLNL